MIESYQRGPAIGYTRGLSAPAARTSPHET